MVRWLSPGDYLALAVSGTDRKARLYKREGDGTLSTLATASSALTLTSSTWYEGKVVIDNDPNDANLEQLRFWVDTDGDGDYSDETTLLTSTAVDDVWSAGYVGLYRAAGGPALQQYDDVKIGYDNNGDGDILDAGDDLQVSDNFSSNVMSLTYDNNGNPTDDGVLRYVYDGWNRLRKAQRYADGDTTTIATYSYLADNRRASKVVEHCGIEAVANDGGDTTVHFYYGGNPSRDREGAVGGLARWNVFETRNGSNQSTRQWVWGTQYVDEVLLMDVNGNPGNSNDCDPDYTPQGDGQDRRYFYHQDRNWNVVALSEYDDGVGVNGRLAERYTYTPYGEFVVLKGDAGSGELGRMLPTSSVGNVFFHQGLAFDREKGGYQNRHREYSVTVVRFAQPDPLGHKANLLVYAYLGNNPSKGRDASGLLCCVCGEALTQIMTIGAIDASTCNADANGALTATGVAFPGNPAIDNQADAFRHCYWSCIATIDIGATDAQKCTDVHEGCNPGPPGSEAMDQHNNALGRSFGSTPSATYSTCYNDCLAAAIAAGPSNCTPPVPPNQAQTCRNPSQPDPPNPTLPGCP